MNQSALWDQLILLPNYLGHHLLMTLSALLAGIVVCLPLAILVTRVRSLQWPVLTFASVAQTIPGIALLALMVPLLGQIGFLPAFIALILYSMLPILRNTVTGILGLAPEIIEAALGLGMTSGQRLIQVELPLASPVIIAGIRTATVWVVGTATLSTPVGATSLGNYIFSGLQTQNSAALFVGCVAAASLAIVLDQLIHLAELAIQRRSRVLGWVTGFSLVSIIMIALMPLVPITRSARESMPVVLGAASFTEQYILAEAFSQRLSQAGLTASSRPSMGSAIIFEALINGHIDCYVAYTGTVWTNFMKREDIPSRKVILEQMTDWLKRNYQVQVLGALGFENTYALAMLKKKAEASRITSIEDLSLYASQLSIGSDYEFFARPEWKMLQKSYRLDFNEQRTFDPTLMYLAVQTGLVDVISAYSTDGRIIDYDLVVLVDPRQVLPPYDAVLLLSSQASKRSELVSALQVFNGAIDNQAMREANKLVDVDGESPKKAARILLKSIRL